MKKLLSILLAAVMVAAMLTGCGSSSGTSSSEPAQSSTENNAASQDTQTQEAKTQEPAGELVEVRFCGYTYGDVPADLQKVVDKFNETYAIPLCNVKLNLEVFSIGQWFQQLNMMLATGEEFDAFPSFGQTMAGQHYSMGQTQDITAALDQYGSYIKENVNPNSLSALSYNGKVIGIPNIQRCAGKAMAIAYRKDLAEKYGFDPDKFSDLDYLEECLLKIKEEESSVQYPIVAGNLGEMLIECTPDTHYTASDASYRFCGSVCEEEDGTTLYGLAETETFKKCAELARKWNMEGLTVPNVSILSSDELQNYFANGQAFCIFGWFYPESVASLGDTYPNVEFDVAYLSYPYVETGDFQVFAVCVPSVSKKADAVVKLMNMIYENIDAFNMIAYGIEGEHYVKTGKDDREIKYPEGVNYGNVGYVNSMKSSFGRVYDGLYFEGSPSALSEETKAFEAKCKKSKFAGFFFDASEYTTEIALINEAVTTYYSDIICGEVDTATALPEFQQALKDAGVEKVIQAQQEQFNAWYNGN